MAPSQMGGGGDGGVGSHLGQLHAEMDLVSRKMLILMHRMKISENSLKWGKGSHLHTMTSHPDGRDTEKSRSALLSTTV